MSEELMKELEDLLKRVREAADDMEFEAGSGRGDPEPSENLDAALKEIRALFARTLSSEG